MECAACHNRIADDSAFCPQCNARVPGSPSYDDCDYAAFISYRHQSPDTEVATRLHRAIETYRLPREVAARYGSPKLGRVFRDQDELPATGSLPDSIREALKRSSTLVVVCSTTTPESRWVAQEIEAFAAFHGRERIYAALAEGRSAESLPESLRYRTQVVDGAAKRIPAEPLAADMRTSASGRFDQEKLRIIAAIAGCNYDDLRQREASRKRKRIAAIAGAAIAIALVIGGLAHTASQQRTAALAQESQLLAAQSQELLAQGDRYGAIETALEALPSSSSDASRPLVPEAQEALEAALEVHPGSTPWKSSYSFSAEHSIGYIAGTSIAGPKDGGTAKTSAIATCERGGYFAISDDEGGVSLYDLETGKPRATCEMPEAATPQPTGDYVRVLLPLDDRIVVSNPSSATLVCFDAQTGDALWTIDDVKVATMAAPEGYSTVYGTAFLQGGGYSAVEFDPLTGDIAEFASSDASEFPSLANEFSSAATGDGRLYCIAVGDKLVAIDRATKTSAHASLAYPTNAGIACYGDIIVAATLESHDGDNLEFHYAIEAFDGDLQPLWKHERTLSPETLSRDDFTMLALGSPAIRGTLSNGSVVASAGRNVYAFDPTTGETTYERGFASTVLAVYPWNTPSDGEDRLFIACTDGSIVAENPLGTTVNLDGDQFRMQLGAPIRWSAVGCCDGLYTWLSLGAEPGSRMVAFRTDLAYGAEPDHEYSLDELIALAQDTLAAGR